MVAAEKEELSLLRSAIQYYMGVGVISVLMHRDDVVEMPLFGLEEPLRDSGGNIAHILAPCTDRIGHEQMRRLSELGLEPRTPALGEAVCQVLDLARLELRFPVQEATRVDDMGRLGGQVFELVHQLRFRMRAPSSDRLEDSRTMPCGCPHELLLPTGLQALHRAADPTPAIPENLSGDIMDGIIQPHGRTPSMRPSPKAA